MVITVAGGDTPVICPRESQGKLAHFNNKEKLKWVVASQERDDGAERGPGETGPHQPLASTDNLTFTHCTRSLKPTRERTVCTSGLQATSKQQFKHYAVKRSVDFAVTKHRL